MRAFTAERNCEKYHDPKSLILALVGEVGVLSEVFQWLPADEAARATEANPIRDRASAEIADVVLRIVAHLLKGNLHQIDIEDVGEPFEIEKHVPGEDPSC